MYFYYECNSLRFEFLKSDSVDNLINNKNNNLSNQPSCVLGVIKLKWLQLYLNFNFSVNVSCNDNKSQNLNNSLQPITVTGVKFICLDSSSTPLTSYQSAWIKTTN